MSRRNSSQNQENNSFWLKIRIWLSNWKGVASVFFAVFGTGFYIGNYVGKTDDFLRQAKENQQIRENFQEFREKAATEINDLKLENYHLKTILHDANSQVEK